MESNNNSSLGINQEIAKVGYLPDSNVATDYFKDMFSDGMLSASIKVLSISCTLVICVIGFTLFIAMIIYFYRVYEDIRSYWERNGVSICRRARNMINFHQSNQANRDNLPQFTIQLPDPPPSYAEAMMGQNTTLPVFCGDEEEPTTYETYV